MANSDPNNNVKMRSLEPYRHLFPPCPDVDHTVKRGATVADTVKFIPQIVKRDSWHVAKFVDQELRGLTTYEVCKKLWEFIYYHITYEKDDPENTFRTNEWVRSARRLIKDGKGDCDCYTTFINKCLYQLNIPITNRIAAYKSGNFQHIYPIVPIGSGKYIVVDCVVDEFNYEQPYSKKEDYPMDLQYLDGIEPDSALVGIDARDLNSFGNEIGELGKLLKKNRSGGGGPAKHGLFKKKTPEQKQQKKAARKAKVQKVKKKVGKVAHKLNRINPATALLRGGILASMKLNILKVPESLKWGYATRDYAQSKGMDMSKYDKLKGVLARTEKIFYGAGGKPENLKKAILTGRGNRNHEVAGLEGMDENTRLPELLGAIYDNEFVNGLEGLGEIGQLGEPATAAAITAASGAMATLAALLKSIGPLFPKKNQAESNDNSGSDEPAPADNSGDETGLLTPSGPKPVDLPEDQTEPASSPEEASEPESSEASEDGAGENEDGMTPEEKGENPGTEIVPDENAQKGNEITSQTGEESTDGILSGPGLGIKAFWQKNKSWMKPTAAVLGLGLVVGLVVYAAKKTKTNKQPRKSQHALNGAGKKRRKRKGGHGGNYGKKTLIPLS